MGCECCFRRGSQVLQADMKAWTILAGNHINIPHNTNSLSLPIDPHNNAITPKKKKIKVKLKEINSAQGYLSKTKKLNPCH